MNKAKILEYLDHSNVVKLKNVCYQPLAIMLEYFVSYSFSLIRLNGSLRFLDYF